MPTSLQSFDQMRQRFACPLHITHRISFGLQQSFQVAKQGLVTLHERFSSSTCLSHWLALFGEVSCFYLSHSSSDRILAHFCLSGYLCYIAAFLGFHCHILPPLLFIEALSHLRVFL